MFRNKIINLLNLHSGLQRFSGNIFDVFGAVFLLALGLPFPAVALAWAGSCVVRFFLRPFSLMLAQKIGVKKVLIIGAFLFSGLFYVISQVTGISGWLYFYAVYLALSDITYWLSYHSYYAAAGDNNARGKQVGAHLGFDALLRMVAPLIGGLVIVNTGFGSLYGIATVVALFSIIPLLFANDVSPGKIMTWREAFKNEDKRGFILQIGNGFLFVHGFVWTIMLYYILKDYTLLGGLVTFELFATFVLSIFLGYFIDKGRGKTISIIGLLLVGLTILIRVFFVTKIPGIIISDVLSAFATIFFVASFEVAFYNLAKDSHNTLWFNFFGEAGWDIGATLALCISVGLFVFGVPLRFLMLSALIGLFIIYRVLKRFYSTQD